jgi:hypothetical protein
MYRRRHMRARLVFSLIGVGFVLAGVLMLFGAIASGLASVDGVILIAVGILNLLVAQGFVDGQRGRPRKGAS